MSYTSGIQGNVLIRSFQLKLTAPPAPPANGRIASDILAEISAFRLKRRIISLGLVFCLQHRKMREAIGNAALYNSHNRFWSALFWPVLCPFFRRNEYHPVIPDCLA